MLGWWRAIPYLSLDPIDNTVRATDGEAVLELKGDLSHSPRYCNGELREEW